MAGIAGIASKGNKESVERMLGRISHRGKAGKVINETDDLTIGIIWNQAEQNSIRNFLRQGIYSDSGDHFRKAEVNVEKQGFSLSRDDLGIAPMYYGLNKKGEFCFASEVKALSPEIASINELLPGHSLKADTLTANSRPQKLPPLSHHPDEIARELRRRLDESVKACLSSIPSGCWLSGGLDSSIISALIGKHLNTFHTFAIGLQGAPDLEYAHAVASFIHSDHHEITVTLKELVDVLPEVIYHLESFDSLLVRSAVINFLAGKEASGFISEVFSGEVSDELFAGYNYLKTVDADQLDDELIHLIRSLHHTALQRVDRCSSAHGMVAHLPFADPEVFNYALQIPVRYKLLNGTEKWILRRAFEGELPENVLHRPKAKFWEGGGVGELLGNFADGKITDVEFRKKQLLPNGWRLNSKEELLYYLIFKDYYSELENLSWMGRSGKSSP